MFDALQFSHVRQFGYENEINHAFYPMFPYLFSFNPVVSIIQQQFMSYCNMFLIYYLGHYYFGDAAVSEMAAYLYMISHSVVY